MAKANDTPTSSPTEPPAPLEGCPSCLARNNHPISTERPDARTVIGHYFCVLCGETWECSWWTGVPNA